MIRIFAVLLLLTVTAGAFYTEAYTGLTCPGNWRYREPPMFCVTTDGVPQKGCVDCGLYAYDLEVQETLFEDCFRVRWYWKRVE